jgi:hypothetical protein
LAASTLIAISRQHRSQSVQRLATGLNCCARASSNARSIKYAATREAAMAAFAKAGGGKTHRRQVSVAGLLV